MREKVSFFCLRTKSCLAKKNMVAASSSMMSPTLRATMEKKRGLVMVVCLFSLLPLVREQRLVADFRFLSDNAAAVLLVASKANPTTPGVNEKSVSSSSPGDDDRPYLVLHLGPKKVGTTFLQSSLSSPRLTGVLLQDNYVYLGKCPFRRTCPLPMPRDCKGIFDSLIMSSSKSTSTNHPFTAATSTSQYWNNQTATLAKELMGGGHINHRSNALLVDENLVLDNPAIASILTSMYRVRVVLGYRRLYEWLVSEYNQVFKPLGTSKPVAYTVWPDDDEQGGGGKALLTFDVENRGLFTTQFEYFKKTGRHPTHILKDESYFPDVHIINQHTLPSPTTTTTDNHYPNHVDPLLRHLVCDIMPNAKHSCQAIKNGLRPENDETRSNSYMNFDYDRLAMAAFERGWINSTSSNNNSKSRAQVVQRIMEYDSNAQQTQGRMPIADYPHDCLSNEKLEMILNLSLLVERNLFGAKAAAGWEEEHRQGFASYKRKFCWVQTDAVLENEEWKLFFMSL